MTKLTLWNDIPRDSGKNINQQILKYGETTQIYDLGDLTGFFKDEMTPDQFEIYWQGIEVLLSVLTEQYDSTKVEVKLVVSVVKE